MNIYGQTKISSELFSDIALGHSYCRFMHKTQVQKSLATVALINKCNEIYIFIVTGTNFRRNKFMLYDVIPLDKKVIWTNAEEHDSLFKETVARYL